MLNVKNVYVDMNAEWVQTGTFKMSVIIIDANGREYEQTHTYKRCTKLFPYYTCLRHILKRFTDANVTVNASLPYFMDELATLDKQTGRLAHYLKQRLAENKLTIKPYEGANDND